MPADHDAIDTPALWFARRSPAKATDPGLLDNLIGGGIAAGEGIAEALLRESWEEAGVPDDLARAARCAGTLDVTRTLPEGQQRETIFCHDLPLPPSFAPRNQDGEVAAYCCVSLAVAAEMIAVADGPDAVTVDASLVVLDLLVRRQLVALDLLGPTVAAALRGAA